jgi:hypothetical protein
MKISYNLKNWYGPNHMNALGIFIFTMAFLVIAALTALQGLQFMFLKLQQGATDVPIYSAVMFMLSLFFIWLSVHNLSCLAMMRWRVRYDGLLAKLDLMESNVTTGGSGMYENVKSNEHARTYLHKFDKSDIFNRWP